MTPEQIKQILNAYLNGFATAAQGKPTGAYEYITELMRKEKKDEE